VLLRQTPVVIVCAVILASAGEQRTAQAAEQTQAGVPQFTLDTTLVLIPVTVTDSANRFVLGLHKEDFHLYEDGSEQTIANFSGEDAPLSIALAFDTSGSMVDKLRTSRRAANQFLATMNGQDEALLIEFGDQAALTVGFTNQFDELQTRLAAATPGGLTAMFDGAQLALHEMKKAKNPRKALLIISDGGDNNSRYSAHEIESLVREADVQIYAMGVFQPSIVSRMNKEDINGARLLSQLAEQTGGRAFSASDASDLPSVASRIAIELRNQYVLAYRSTNRNKDGKYRKVEVKVAAPGIPNIKVHWRLGYYAPSQ
jgi:Ca-activated chloride channel family protein